MVYNGAANNCSLKRAAGIMRIAFLIFACALVIPAIVWGQIAGPEFNELNDAIGSRLQTSLVLATANGINTGGYKWSLNDTSGNVTRVTWEFDVTDKKPIGDTGLSYLLDSDGGVGYANYDNHFENGPLDGNDSKFRTLALGETIGPRVFFNDYISLLPQFGLIYGYTHNTFNANTSSGDKLESEVPGTDVDWTANTLTITPGLQFQYERTFKSLKVQFRSGWMYYNTLPIATTNDVFSLRSESESWQNGIDLDYDLGFPEGKWHYFVGGQFSRTDLWGGLREAMAVDNYYDVSARVVIKTKHTPFYFNQFGLGGGYTFGKGFHGTYFGLVVGLAF
jgi:hypothetical protein